MDNLNLFLSERLKVKRKVFISYHHENDQYWADYMRDTYSEQYDIFYDKSLDEEIDSTDPEYVNRKIREDYIVGTSITIVLCGAETWKRRYVDWEIYSTLYHKHALLGISLPTASKGYQGRIVVPERLHLNIQSGYAHWINWPTNATVLQFAIEAAINKSKETSLINNSLPKMRRNKS